MMMYEKGSKVEVLKRREREVGCWRTGEVIGWNGRVYIVRFDVLKCCHGGGGGSTSPLVQAVRPGFIRLCPPVVKVEKLRCGDVVEVLVDFGWITATVLRVVRNGYVWVMIGDCEKIRVRKGDVRIKQTWIDDEWVVVKQISHASARGKKISAISSEIMQTKPPNNIKGPNAPAVAKKTSNQNQQARLKRKSHCGNNHEQCCELTRKSRAIEKDSLIFRAPAVIQSPLTADPGTGYRSTGTQEKAQACSFWRKLWFSEQNPLKENPSDSDATLSSVGSCSFTSNGNLDLHQHTLRPKCSQEFDGYVSDAESFCGISAEKDNSFKPVEKTVLAEVQRWKEIRPFAGPCDLLLKLIVVFTAYAILR